MKTARLIALLTVAAACMAQAETNVVSSANVVGYNQITLKPGYNIIRMPFVSGTNSVDIQSVMITSNLVRGTSALAADSIQFWDTVAQQYKVYFVHDGTGKNNASKLGKWIDSTTSLIASNVVPPVAGFFFTSKATSNINVTVSGDVVVSTTGTNNLALVEGYNLVANPFTCDWPLNDGSINWTNQGAKAGTSVLNADSVQFWDTEVQQYKAYYLHDGSGKNNSVKLGKWVDGTTSLIASNLTVELSQGFFYSRVIGQGSVNIKIEQPYDLQ